MIDSIIDYFSTISSSHRAIIIVSGLTLFSLIESAVPLFSLNYKRWQHASVNIFFTLTTIIVNFILAFLLLKTSDYVVSQDVGLLQWIDMPIVLSILIGLMLLDFISGWIPHWLEHHVKWMWQFHLIHHTDQNVDATSANRHHPGESVLRFVFTILATVIVGAPIWLILLYQSLSVILTQFNHSNFHLPSWLDKVLVSFICTPNMHHVHHHYRQPYSDTNYGNIFSIWDRLFSTFTKVNNEKLVYGLDTHMDKNEASNILELLKAPFRPYRDPLEYDQSEKL